MMERKSGSQVVAPLSPFDPENRDRTAAGRHDQVGRLA